MRFGFVFCLIIAFAIFLMTALVDGIGVTGLMEAKFQFHPRNWVWIGYGVAALVLFMGGLLQFRSQGARIAWSLCLLLGACGIPRIHSQTYDPESLRFRHFHCTRILRPVFLNAETQNAFEKLRLRLTPRQNFWIAQASSYCRMLEMERGFHAGPSRTLADYLKFLEFAHAQAPLTLTEWLYAQETSRTETFETESFFQDLKSKAQWTAKSALILTQLSPMLPNGQTLTFDEKKSIVLEMIPALGSSLIFRGVERFL